MYMYEQQILRRAYATAVSPEPKLLVQTMKERSLRLMSKIN